MTQRRALSLAWLFAAGLLIPGTPAAAQSFAEVRALLAMVPDATLQDIGGIVFEFGSPAAAVAAGLRPAAPGLGGGYADAFADLDGARRLGGFDLGAVDGILEYGRPGAVIAVLRGPAGIFADLPATLLARGFAQSQEGEAAMFALGSDPEPFDPDDESEPERFEIDLADPFTHGLPRPVRVALAGDALLVAGSSPVLRAALPFRFGDATGAPMGVFQVMLDAAAGPAGSDARIVRAHGFTLAAFAGGPLPVFPDPGESIEDYRRRLEAQMQSPGAPVPPFVLAMFVASIAGDRASAQLVIAYPDAATAEAGSAEVARRLEAFHPDDRAPGFKVATTVALMTSPVAGTVPVAVVGVAWPAAAAGAADREVLRWLAALWQRDFSVLQALP